MRTTPPLRATAALATLALAAVLPVTPAPAAATEGDTTTVNLLGITDFHGHIDRSVAADGTVSEPGAVTLACEVQKARTADPSTLFVSAGDNVGGSAYTSSVLDDEPTIAALNAMKLDVTAAGNHEFDQGITDLADRIIPELDAPVLSANVTGSSVLSSEGNGDGTYIKTVNGIKVGFIGVVTDDLPSLVSKSALSDLTMTSSIETANAEAKTLKDSGEADVVVVLAHEDAEIYGSQFTDDVDAVFGGHTHLPYAQTITRADGSPLPIVQADHYGYKLGDIDLTVNTTTKKVTAATATNTDLTKSDCTTDAYGVSTIVSDADSQAETEGSKTIATLDTAFYRGTNDGSTDSSSAGSNRSTESTASNLLADSFQSWIAKDIKPTGDFTIGLMNPGGVRADFAAGDLTSGDAYMVQPFGNDMAYATYTGAQIKEVLAEQWQPTTTRATLTLGVSSNVKVVVDQDAATELEGYFAQISSGAACADSLADKIAAARAKVISTVTIDGKELSDTASVVVASSTFLLAGGDSFTTLGDATMTDTGFLDRDVTAEYLKAEQPLSASYTKRQVGESVSTDSATGEATVGLTGLLFTPASEQAASGAAKSVSAMVPTTEGDTMTLATADVDGAVTAGLPETGKATLSFTLPADAATQACSTSTSSTITLCATVTLAVTSNGGDTTGTYAVEVPVPDSATTEPTASPTTEPTSTPTAQPSASSTAAPTAQPTAWPTVRPTPGAGSNGFVEGFVSFLKHVIGHIGHWIGPLWPGL